MYLSPISYYQEQRTQKQDDLPCIFVLVSAVFHLSGCLNTTFVSPASPLSMLLTTRWEARLLFHSICLRLQKCSHLVVLQKEEFIKCFMTSERRADLLAHAEEKQRDRRMVHTSKQRPVLEWLSCRAPESCLI